MFVYMYCAFNLNWEYNCPFSLYVTDAANLLSIMEWLDGRSMDPF